MTDTTPTYDIAADLKNASPVAHLILGTARNTYETWDMACDEDSIYWRGRFDGLVSALAYELKGVSVVVMRGYEDAIRAYIKGEAS